MPDSAAKRKLKRMTAWDVEPALSEQEIDDLLAEFARIDADGYAPSDASWTPTYNFRAAAKAGWETKAGRASALISSDLDGDRMSANQLFDHCMAMVKKYSGTPTMNLGTGASLEDPLTEKFFEEN